MRLTNQKRLEIISYINSNKSNREIARIVGASPSTVGNIIAKFKSQGNTDDNKRSGRPRSTTIQDDRLICLTARRHPFYSCKDILDTIDTLRNKRISTRTINNRLIEKKLFSYAATRKPLLTNFDRYRRIKFCRQILRMSQLELDNIIFSDESNFQVINRDTKQRVRRLKGEKYLPQHITARVQAGGGSIGIWGCIHSSGIGVMKSYMGRLDRFGYLNILDNCLIPSMELFNTENAHLIFQQDNAPAHTAKIVTDWFSRKNITKLNWPPRSPDLNLIENLWSYVDRKLSKIKITTREQLISELLSIWLSIPPELVKKLYSSLKNRCRLILANKGRHIPY